MQLKEMLHETTEALKERHGEDILIIDVADKTIIADRFVIAGASSTLQSKALCDAVEDRLAKAQVLPLRKEGYDQGRWIVMDYGDVLVHIFHRDERAFYNLERLWMDGGNVTEIKN